MNILSMLKKAKTKKLILLAFSIILAIASIIAITSGIDAIEKENKINIEIKYNFNYNKNTANITITPSKKVDELYVNIDLIAKSGNILNTETVYLGNVNAGEKKQVSIYMIKNPPLSDRHLITSAKATFKSGNIERNIENLTPFAIGGILFLMSLFFVIISFCIKFKDSKENGLIDRLILKIHQKRKKEKCIKTRSQRIGEQGEDNIANILSKQPHPQRILRNLYIPKSNGETTEIDLVFINRNGIFVIESKNYKGWIFGTVAQKLWTVKYIGGETQQLFNPIWQNRSHVKHLQEQLDDIPEDLFYSLTIFGSDAEIKTQIGDLLPRENVISLTDLQNYINSQTEKRNNELSEAEIDSIANILQIKFCNKNQETKKKHTDNIEKKNNQKKSQKYSCIICGSATSGEKICANCLAKLEAEGIKIETSKKCILCGADSGADKLCPTCRKKLEDEDLLKEEPKAKRNNTDQNYEEPTHQTTIINEAPEESHGCRNCCLTVAIILFVLFIIICIIAGYVGVTIFEILKDFFPFLK